MHEAKSKFGVASEIIKILNDFVLKTRTEAEKNPDSYPDLKNFYVKSAVLGAKPGPTPAHPALEYLRIPQITDIVETAKKLL